MSENIIVMDVPSIIKLHVYIYLNFSQSTTIFLVYIMFIIYNIQARMLKIISIIYIKNIVVL